MKAWHLMIVGAAGLLLATGCSKSEAPSAPENSATTTDRGSDKAPQNKTDTKKGDKDKAVPKEVKSMEVKVPWSGGTDIPMKYVHTSKNGENVSPAVSWTAVDGAVQYLVVMVDHHKVAHDWLHWVATVPGSVTSIPEGASTRGVQGLKEYPNTWGNARYEGPAAPKGTGKHDYHVVVFALSREVSLPAKPTWATIEEAVKGITVGKGEVVGYYETK